VQYLVGVFLLRMARKQIALSSREEYSFAYFSFALSCYCLCLLFDRSPSNLVLVSKMEGEGKKYWLISAPKTREDTFNTLNKKTADELDLSVNYKFHVPELKGIKIFIVL
jgi:hypothetical protein